MARSPFALALVACAALAGLVAGGDDPDRRQRNLLGVHVALEQGQAMLQRGDFAAAVSTLEAHLAHIDGNRAYLAALRDAYRGYVAALERDGKQAEARRYRGFLAVLEPVRPARVETPAATLAAPAAVPAARAKVEQDGNDPFAESNRAREKPSSLLARADQEFGRKNYDAASRLYAEAEQAQTGAASDARDRWGYCRLHGAAKRLNQGDGGEALEAEVRSAMRLSPRLEGFGQKLLEKAKQPAAVAVKHSGKTGSWGLAETDNFRVFHKGNDADAERAARVAEAARLNMSRKWFNEEPAGWSPRCDLYLHPTGEDYARETGAPATAPGHSTISLDAGRVVKRRIDLRCDDANAMTGVLPHETTHVVLAGRFGTHHVPRWADEGMAVLSEPRDRAELHLRNLPSHRRGRELFEAGALMRQSEYPDGPRIGAFYAQSVSVVDFLVRKKDPVTFTRFVRLGLDKGYELALEQYYGYRSFAEMERDWTASAFGGEVAANKR